MRTKPVEKVASPPSSPEDDDEEFDDDGGVFNAENCPWGWCQGDNDAHRDLCIHSKFNYGVSWGFTHGRYELFKLFGYDIWERNGDDGIVTPLDPDNFVYPPDGWVPTPEVSDEEDDEENDIELDIASDEDEY